MVIDQSLYLKPDTCSVSGETELVWGSKERSGILTKGDNFTDTTSGLPHVCLSVQSGNIFFFLDSLPPTNRQHVQEVSIYLTIERYHSYVDNA